MCSTETVSYSPLHPGSRGGLGASSTDHRPVSTSQQQSSNHEPESLTTRPQVWWRPHQPGPVQDIKQHSVEHNRLLRTIQLRLLSYLNTGTHTHTQCWFCCTCEDSVFGQIPLLCWHFVLVRHIVGRHSTTGYFEVQYWICSPYWD